jgi:hypothetical protein
MPAGAIVLAPVLRLDEPLGVGLLLLGVAAGAPFLPKLAQIANGNLAFAVALMVLLTLSQAGAPPAPVVTLFSTWSWLVHSSITRLTAWVMAAATAGLKTAVKGAIWPISAPIRTSSGIVLSGNAAGSAARRFSTPDPCMPC